MSVRYIYNNGSTNYQAQTSAALVFFRTKIKIPQRLLIIISVAKKVQIPNPFFPWRDPSVVQQDLGSAVVKHRVSIARDYPAFQADCAVRSIQRPCRTSKAAALLSKTPDAFIIAAAPNDLYTQSMTSKLFLIILQVDPRGMYLYAILRLNNPIGGFGKIL